MELFISIFENSSPKGSFRQNKINYEILQLSADSRYLQSGPLKEVVQNNENKLHGHGLLPALNTSRSNLGNTTKFFYVQRPKSLNYVPDLQLRSFQSISFFILYFLTNPGAYHQPANHNFALMYSCFVSVIRFFYFSLQISLLVDNTHNREAFQILVKKNQPYFFCFILVVVFLSNHNYL